MILGGPNFYRKLEFQFGVLKFPLKFRRKTQISLRIFESSLAGHAGCYYPIFEPFMLMIFEVWGTRAVRSDRKHILRAHHVDKICMITLYKLSTVRWRIGSTDLAYHQYGEGTFSVRWRICSSVEGV